MDIFIKYFFLLFLSVQILNIIGFAVTKIFKINFNRNFKGTIFSFYNLISGIFITTSVFAVYSTGFQSIMLVSIIGVVCIFLYSKLNQPSIESPVVSQKLKTKKTIIDHFADLLILTIIFSINFYQWYDFDTNQIIPSKGDVAIYSAISQFISLTGNENTLTALNLINDKYHGLSLYHYFDLWFNSFLTITTRQNNFTILVLITYPILQFACYAGIKELILSFSKDFKIFSYQLLVILLLFVSGFKFYSFLKLGFIDSSFVFAENIFTRPKIISIVLVNLLVINLGITKRYFYALLFLSLLPIFYFPTYICVMGGFFLFIIYCTFFKNTFFTRFELQALIFHLILINFLFILIFQLQKSNFNSHNTITIFDLIKNNDTSAIIRAIFSPIIKSAIIIPIIFLPYFLFIIYYYRELYFHKTPSEILNNKAALHFILLLLLFTTLSGIAIWIFLFYSPDSWQLLHNYFVPLFNLVIILVIIKYICEVNIKKRNLVTICILFFLTINIIETYFTVIEDKKHKYSEIVDKADLADLKSELRRINPDENKAILGASIFNNNKYNTIYERNLLFSREGYYIKNIRNNVGIISLNFLGSKPTRFISKQDNFAFQDIFFKIEHIQSPLYQFILDKKNKAKLTASEIRNIQANFILENKIKFIITDTTFNIPANIPLVIKSTMNIKSTNDKIYFFE